MSWLPPIEIGAIQGLVMLGAVLSFAIAFRLLGFPDLTVEGAMPLGAATYAVMAHGGYSLGLALLAACIVGAMCGALTAFLHVVFKVNKFLAGIIVVAVAYSLSLRVMSGPNVSLLQSGSLFSTLSSFAVGAPPLLILGLIWLPLLGALSWFFGGPSGIRLRAVGSNPVFAQSVGVSTKIATVAGLAACNVLAAFAGVLQCDYQGFADVSTGQGVLILALAALAIGEAVVPSRRLVYYKFVLIAAVIGSMAYQIILAVAVRAGLPQTDLRLATGVLVLAFVALGIRNAAQAQDESESLP
jgi:putative ABC transport system permease protein